MQNGIHSDIARSCILASYMLCVQGVFILPLSALPYCVVVPADNLMDIKMKIYFL